MKKLILFFFIVAITAVGFILIAFSEKKESMITITGKAEKKSFVVMELFTSQGCSSCPAADKVLETYVLQNDEQIIPLSFHVDYWNRLGWIDSFSNQKYTQRQNEYASKFNLESVYTPQLIINGQKQLVGSDKDMIAAMVSDELNEIPPININIIKTKTNDSKIIIDYAVDLFVANTNINAALVQDKVFTQIKAGENKGIKMYNYNIVRDFSSDQLKNKTGTCVLQIPPGNTSAGFHIVLFIQQKGYGKIIAVAQRLL